MSDEEAPFLKEEPEYNFNSSQPARARRWASSPVLPWLLVIAISVYTLFLRISPKASLKSSNVWTSTDFIPARNFIARTEVKFSSSLDWLDEKHIFRISDPTQPVYVGNDTENIDREWHNIIYPADLTVTEEEAKNLSGNLHRSPVSGKFKIESALPAPSLGQCKADHTFERLEVFHSLHCLNMIRKRLYSDMYPEMLTDNAKIHVDHCIESLRELIMCEGNLTPIPLEWSQKGKKLNPNYATTHSCRNFNVLKDFAIERSKE